MSDSFVQVAPDDASGKKIQTFEQVVGSNTVQAQAVVLVDSAGNAYLPNRIKDDSAILSVDGDARKLYADDGTTQMLAWQFADIITFGPSGNWGSIRDVSGSFFLSIDAIRNWNGDGVANIDLLNRKLYADDGTTEMLDWHAEAGITNPFLVGTAFEGVAIPTIRFFGNQAALGAGDDDTHGAYLGVDGLTNWFGDAFPNIDLLHRILYHPDGTTWAIRYGATGNVDLVKDDLGSNPAFTATSSIGYDGWRAGIYTDSISDMTGSGEPAIDVKGRALYGNGHTEADEVMEWDTGILKLLNLPSSDPTTADQVWDNGGLLVLGNFSSSAARDSLGAASIGLAAGLAIALG